MDLIDQLAKLINKMPGLPTKISKSYLDKDYYFGIYMLPGSKIIEEDMAGNQEKSLPIEIAFRSNDFDVANKLLWRISDMLDNLTSLETDDTYEFERLIIQPQPFLAGADVNGEGVFLLDFTVEVLTKRKR